MYFNPLLTTLLFTTAALAQTCGKAGWCDSPTYCTKTLGGSVSLDLCPGGDDNRCCTYPAGQCGTKGRGTCKYTSSGCSGTWQTGLCPGGDNYKCCVP